MDVDATEADAAHQQDAGSWPVWPAPQSATSPASPQPPSHLPAVRNAGSVPPIAVLRGSSDLAQLLRWGCQIQPRMASSLVRVQLTLRKGRISDNATISEASAGDYKAWKQGEALEQTLNTVTAPQQPLRRTVGYVSFGCFSFARGKGFAVGFMLAEAARSACELRHWRGRAAPVGKQGVLEARGLVLVRDANSAKYRMADMQLANSAIL